MHYIAEIGQRRALLLAAALFLCGSALLGWTLLSRLPAPAAAGAAADIADAELLEDEGLAEPEGLAEAPQPTAQPPMLVYVSGAVVAPDVYQLPAGARIKDLVLAAGGLSAEADARAVNLAARLSDAQHVHIPARGEAPAGAPSSAGPAEQAPLDINSASASELDALPGVGPAIAERIVAYRQANGPFVSIDDLRNVQGVGPSLLEKIAPLIQAGS